MRGTIAGIPIAALAAFSGALAQGVSEAIPPDERKPAECSDTSMKIFQITPVDVQSSSSARSRLAKRQYSGILECTLEGGVLKDQADRTGYIASNYQYGDFLSRPR